MCPHSNNLRPANRRRSREFLNYLRWTCSIKGRKLTNNNNFAGDAFNANANNNATNATTGRSGTTA